MMRSRRCHWSRATRAGKPRPDSGRLIRQIGSCQYALQLLNIDACANSLAALLKQLRYNSRPSRLMAGPDPRAIVAMEVLVEEDQVLPVRIFVIEAISPMNRPTAILSFQEDPCHSTRKLGGDFPQSHHLPRPGRALDPEVVTEVVMELLQGL